MANKKVENYAHKYGLSNRQAKKRLGKGSRSENELHRMNIVRGAPVPGTGKPKGASH
jgi:hypothetical protein